MTITRSGRWGLVAVAAVALAAAGAAFAATKFHGSSAASSAGPVADGPGFGRGDGVGDRGFGMRPRGGGLSAASTYLGLSQSDLFQQLQSGKTLAQIANATSGKSAAGLIDAMVAAEQSEIAAAVRSGMLTQAMADRISADLKARVTAMVNGTFGPGRGGFRGFGPPGGQTPQAPSSTPPTHI